MSKVTKYPKYKEEAYSRLNKLFRGILKESGFYTQHPELESDGLVFSHDPSEDLRNQMSVSVRGITLLKVNSKDISYNIPRGIRLRLTSEERKLLTDNLLTLMGVGEYNTVLNYTGGDLHSWYISSEICRFVGTNGDVYINSKSYRPQIIGRLPKKEKNNGI